MPKPILVFVAFLALTVLVLPAAPSRADEAEPAPSAQALLPLGPIPAAASANSFDAEAATRAYLDTVPADAHARSDAYFEGGYWLILVGFLEQAVIAVLLLHTGFSARARDWARKVSRVRFVSVALYWAAYLVATSLLSFPLEIYTGFVREHSYGLSNMTFGAWLGDEAKGTAVALVFGALFVPVLYAVIAGAKQTWWIWGSLVCALFVAFATLVSPVFVEPLFNHYVEVTNPIVREPILSLARANGIHARSVWEFDASRQSNRVSANVNGLFGTERIALNDNLLKRCSLEEIEAVMGHEMGHYVLHHLLKGLVDIVLLIVGGFAFVHFGFDRLRRRYDARWRLEGIDDPAGLPLVMLLISAYFFVLTPVTNTLVRSQEAEADIFGLNASGQPDGMAQVALKLGEYRKLEPGPIEEFVFFDHPSGRSRIGMAMRWKAEHLPGPHE